MKDRTMVLIPAKPAKVPTHDRPFHVAAYCRANSLSDEQELSLETQIQYYAHVIESNALWENAGIYVDQATGHNMKQRAEFKKLLAKCRIGKIDLMLTKSISRLGRN